MRRVYYHRLLQGMLSLVIFSLLCGTAMAWAESLRRIVSFVEGTPVAVQKAIIQESGSTILHHFDLLNVMVIQLSSVQPEKALVRLRNYPEVEEVARDSRTAVKVAPVDVDPVRGGYTWNLRQIYFHELPPRIQKQGGKEVTIAVLDTGIDFTHPDLADVVIGGYNARAGEDPRDYIDRNGHGTHIAGIIAGKAGRPTELLVMRGIAPKAKLYAVRVLDEEGSGYQSDLVRGLVWVYRHPEIRVVNMSLGFYEGSKMLQRIIKLLHNAGVVLIASAGNYDSKGTSGEGMAGEGMAGEGMAGEGMAGEGMAGEDTKCEMVAGEGMAGEGMAGEGECSGLEVNYPARYQETIAVAATNSQAEITYYSIQGPEVDITAPGGSILNNDPIISTTLHGGYGEGSGTSQAAAHVTGLVALMLSVNPDLAPEEVREILQETAIDLGAPWEAQGAGLIDAAQAVAKVKR